MKKSVFKGSILVALGAASYGLLATFVKLAYQEKYTLSEITGAQFTWGILGLFILNLFIKPTPQEKKAATLFNKLKLVIAGVSLGLTSTFYYFSVQYIPVSMAIVLLMQTVWMGVVLEMILSGKLPSRRRLLAVLLILLGTVFATNAAADNKVIEWKGIGWGMLAALSYTVSVFSSNRIALKMNPYRKTFWMLAGGFITVMILSVPHLMVKFDLSIFWKWGIILALFGTILPPILFNLGMPKTGLGLSAMLSSIEIPVSVFMAYFILNEPIGVFQWLGIILIIFTVIWMNRPGKAS